MKDLVIPALSEMAQTLPLILVFIFACIPITIKIFSGNREPSNNVSLAAGLLGLGLAAFAVCLNSATPTGPIFSGSIIFDKLSIFSTMGILLIGASALLIAASNVNTKGPSFAEHVFMVLISVFGMIIMVSTTDLIVAFVGLEIMSIALYILIALGHEQEVSKEAAFKYFLLGSFAAAIFLYGIALYFGMCGSAQLSPENISKIKLGGSFAMIMVCLVCLLAGVAFKISLVPFHAWTPDVYQGAPTSVTAFMATGVKLVMFSFFIRMASSGLLGIEPHLIQVLVVIAVVTMTVGNISAIVQDNLKRVLAYSSIAHAGYAMVGVIAASGSGSGSGSNEAASATLFYMVSYAAMNMGAFAVVSAFEKEKRGNLSVSDYAGLGFKNPYLSLALAMFMLSLAGIPPMVGFIGKFYLFSAAIKEGYVWLAVFGVLNSIVSVYYYLRVLIYLYMEESVFDVRPQSGFGVRFVIGAAAAIVLVLGVYSNPVYQEAVSSLKVLFHP